MSKSEATEAFRYKKAGIGILIILHVAGVIGFMSPLREWFVFLTPLNIIATAGMLWIDTRAGTHAGWAVAISIALAGYAIEVAGVHSGHIFGDYAYLDVLGWKVLQVPPIIGLNWLIVIWGGYSVAHTIEIPKNLRWLVSALLVTALDIVIEPVAVHFEFWTWHGSAPPVQNYIAWFVIAAIMSRFFELYPLVQKPRLGFTAYCVQLLFFGVLYIYAVP